MRAVAKLAWTWLVIVVGWGRPASSSRSGYNEQGVGSPREANPLAATSAD
jgi:hypothetical protein